MVWILRVDVVAVRGKQCRAMQSLLRDSCRLKQISVWQLPDCTSFHQGKGLAQHFCAL